MKNSKSTIKSLFLGLLLVLLGLLPGCCWNRCLQKCKSCTDCEIEYEPQKSAYATSQEEREIIELDE